VNNSPRKELLRIEEVNVRRLQEVVEEDVDKPTTLNASREEKRREVK
jgi:hypothetical protein